MKIKVRIRKEIKVAVALAMVLALIAFSERRHRNVTCKNVVIHIDNIEGNHFIDEDHVMQMIAETGIPVVGISFKRLALRTLEHKLKTDHHIGDAQLYGDLSGNLFVNVRLRRPIARLVPVNGPGAYVAEDGAIMNLSDKFSSRVVLISGDFVKKVMKAGTLTEAEGGAELLEMIHHISEDNFWHAQIAQMDIDERGQITIYPQVTGQLVEFGSITGYREKLRKLMIFYKEILPQKGWNRYDRVNVEYEGQVIAE